MSKGIWLVEPLKLIRDLLRSRVSGVQFEILREFGSLDQLMASSEAPPDLIIISLHRPFELGDEDHRLLVSLCARSQQTPVVVLAEEMSLSQLACVFRAGVRGYLISDIGAAALQQSLSLVLLGERVLPTKTIEELHALRMPERLNSTPDNISKQEQNILSQLALGRTNKLIARKLNIAEATVKVHMKSVLRKIGAQNRTQAAVWAMKHLSQTLSQPR